MLVLRKIAILLRIPQDRQSYFNLLKNKYVLSSLIFIFWVCFGDESSLWMRMKMQQEFAELSESISYYKEKIEKDRYEMEELEKSDNLERLARERYLMKAKNEDIYLIVEEE